LKMLGVGNCTEMVSGSASFRPSGDVVQLAGPMLMSNLLDPLLFGALSVQLYLYYQAFPRDKPFVKGLVYTIYLLGLFTTIVFMHDAFAKFGYGFSDPSSLTDVSLAWVVNPSLGGLIAFIGQSFYAYRIHVLSKNRLIPCLIFVTALIGCIGAFTSAVYIAKVSNITLLQTHRNSVIVGLWCGVSAACDIIIAICMTYYLTKNDTGFRQTHALVTRLIRLIIETGTLTAVAALATLILFIALPQNLYYSTLSTILTKLYANSILVVLNSRIKIVGGRGMYSSDETISAVFNAGTAANTECEQPSFVAITREVSSDANLDSGFEMKAMGGARVDASVQVSNVEEVKASRTRIRSP